MTPVLHRGEAGPVTLREMTDADWPAVRAVYEAGIATGNATFETTAPTWEQWDAGHLTAHRLVAVVRGTPDDAGATDDGPGTEQVIGWAALSPVSSRCVYGGVTEASVYVDPAHQGRGAGRRLLQALLDESEAAGIWTVQSGIFPENTASLALHERCGFRLVGRRERVGRLDGTWRDVILMERRSATIV